MAMRARATWWALISLALLGGCRCQRPDVAPLEPADVIATPERLAFAATYVGQRSSKTVVLTNRGGEPAALTLSIDQPFTLRADQLSLARGQAESIELDFAPSRAGTFTGALRAGNLEILVEGVGVEVPECVAPSSCVASQFDFDTDVCVQTREPDGTNCETTCVSGGCIAGECIGNLKGCDDANACTIDACSETNGCSHSARSCAPLTDPCKVASCDPLRGCVAEPVPDGTLCGPDECRALYVDVCISGECVQRTRPTSGRCANRWVPITIPARTAHAMAYDAARRRVVLFGGAAPDPLADTWEWDGQRWLLRTPAASPPARVRHAMAWDPIRQRVVLFGGRDANDRLLDDTWEWDGSNWVQRRPSTSPPARSEHAMVLDEARQRIVLMGGLSSTGLLDDFWEWNGTTWTSRTHHLKPPARRGHAAAYDPDRQRIVLFGGAGEFGLLTDTWEWNGTTWTDHSTQQPIWLVPSGRVFSRMGYDAVRRRMLLFAGVRADGVEARDGWEWDGTYWAAGVGGFGSPALAVDTHRQRIVLFGTVTQEWDGSRWTVRAQTASSTSDTVGSMVSDLTGRRVLLFSRRGLSEWNGASWTFVPPYLRGRDRIEQAMAWDSARNRLVLFGGLERSVVSDPSEIFEDTVEWSSTTQWSVRTPASHPPGRGMHVMVYDSTQQQVLLVGGSDGTSWLADTWSWDGTTWTLRSSTAPNLGEAAFAYDEARQRAVLFGGDSGETWTWDGQQWHQEQPLTSPSGRSRHSMAYDPSRQRVLLFGGSQATGLLDDTWEWDGTTWTQRAPLTSPPASENHAMTFDQAGQRMMLLVGGVMWLFLP